MRALQQKTPIYSIVFVSPRYWPNAEETQKVVSEIAKTLTDDLYKQNPEIVVKNITISSENELEAFLGQHPEGFGLFIPISGAVQPWMIKAAENFDGIGILAAYEPGFLEEKTAYRLLEANAAPAVADVYSVIKRKGLPIVLSNELEEIVVLHKAIQAVMRMKKTSMILVGKTEDWVISSCRSFDRIRDKTGIECTNIELQELYKMYESVSNEEAQPVYEKWLKDCQEIVEPDSDDVIAASRLAVAIQELVQRYNADGIAIACFTLLKELGTTSCLALSMLNDSENYIGACEGDLDSAVTLLMMKALTNTPSWMANPMIEKGNVLKLSHCSAPLIMAGKSCSYKLRSHHESGIGVSPQVSLPEGLAVTITRVGDDLSSISVNTGITVDTIYTPTCRTQLRIRLDSMTDFIENLLGCHQIVTYGNHLKQVSHVAKLLGLKILN
ncbi:MAG TPA: hypothetical protein GX514_04660 [Thermoanaerobacterales bacterium]|uniref:hypothetical protein n=1 Tax=Tepidanaerobacter sp. GT38 TaxID=2722793 RepID=UPI0017E31CD7|nr:hypothetical protein [Tepidanaerobacter sp. GT38]MCG1011023.1 hypothetical protein [Tepidanaerobacter sp. GT38]HHY42122.1 hypothetical protein [Thermoanaerobacterales bacterium]